MGESGDGGDQSYQKYSSRWLVLLTVTMLNLSNNALWISYSAVANVSADYFQKDVNTDIDLLSTISFYVGIPMCLVSTYVVDALGFRTGQSPPLLSCLPSSLQEFSLALSSHSLGPLFEHSAPCLVSTIA